MKCVKCHNRNGTIIIPSLEQKACTYCFSEIIEKRFSKTLNEYYKKLSNANIFLARPSDEVLIYLLKNKGVNVSSKKGKETFPKHTLDDVAVSVLESFFTKKNVMIKTHSPIELISESELAIYALIKKLKFKTNKRTGKNKEYHDFILKLDKRRPGVMYSIKKFRDKIYS